MPHPAAQGAGFTVSGTLTGVARELILTGLAGGDNKALAERLMQIERRLVTLESLARDVSGYGRADRGRRKGSSHQASRTLGRAVLG